MQVYKKMRGLTENQTFVVIEIEKIQGFNFFELETIKSRLLSNQNIKNVSSAFNTLLHKGYFDYYRANSKNEFILTNQGYEKLSRFLWDK